MKRLGPRFECAQKSTNFDHLFQEQKIGKSLLTF